jgi:hypothetical protein
MKFELILWLIDIISGQILDFPYNQIDVLFKVNISITNCFTWCIYYNVKFVLHYILPTQPESNQDSPRVNQQPHGSNPHSQYTGGHHNQPSSSHNHQGDPLSIKTWENSNNGNSSTPSPLMVTTPLATSADMLTSSTPIGGMTNTMTGLMPRLSAPHPLNIVPSPVGVGGNALKGELLIYSCNDGGNYWICVLS